MNTEQTIKMFCNETALFSADREYRYWLYRNWNESKPVAACIGLNPSTANERTDDPTIRRLKSILNNHGYGGFYMLNLFALVSVYPTRLLTHENPIGDNEHWIETLTNARDVIFCWGAFPQAKNRAQEVINRFPYAKCFGQTSDGSPKHPLYLPSDVDIKTFTPHA